MCPKHYTRWRQHGDPLRGRQRRPLAERFWPKVDKNGPTPEHCPDLGPCWLWTGSRERYGKIKLGGKSRLGMAERVAYELLIGPIPDDLELGNLCRITTCVNPSHWEPMTRSEIEQKKYAATEAAR